MFLGMVSERGRIPVILLKKVRREQRKEFKMRVYYKVVSVIVLFACLIFYSGIAFAQDADALKADIYSKLKCCSCKVSFDKCTCSEASQMKAYIDALLEGGISQEEIFYKVAKKFSLDTILDAQIKKEIEAKLTKEVGDKRPQIVLDSTSFDFGLVSKKKGKASKIFKISNKGSSPLIIKQIKTSCPCATVSLEVNKTRSPYFGTEGSPKDWQVEIKPQETGELELIVDFASSHVRTGKLIREAYITTSDPLYPECSVRVEAEVTE